MLTEAYLELRPTFVMELFCEIVNGFEQLTIFGKKSSVLDVSLGSKCASCLLFLRDIACP